MNNEKLETRVSGKKNTSRVLFIVLGLIVLGIIALFAGIKIFSKISISADSGLPPIPGDPLEETVTSTTTSTASRTSTVTQTTSSTSTSTATSTPIGPDNPVGPPISVTIKSGWSMMSGTELFGYDMSPITQKGIYFYTYNDPFLASRSWIISSPSCSGQTDYFCTSLTSYRFKPYPFVGYYVYNPGSQVTLSLNQTATTGLNKSTLYARGWHLMHWAGAAATKAEVLKNASVSYNDNSSLYLSQAISDEYHTVSGKIYVIMSQGDITSSTVKELADSDTSTTVSKIPQDSYFWVYLRRTKSYATLIGVPYSSNQIYPPSLPNQSTITNNSLPPVPPSPN